MPFNANNPQNIGLYLPTTQIWDPVIIEQYNLSDKDQLKELFVRLYRNLSTMSDTINLKESAYYPQQEFMTSQQFFTGQPNVSNQQRPSFRQTINFGALPDTTTKQIAHNLTLGDYVTATNIYGAATKPASLELIPLPYASTIGDNIELWIDATYVNIATKANWSAYTKTIVVIEYLKN